MEGTDEREGTSTMSANTDKGVFGNKDCCVYTVQQACEDVPHWSAVLYSVGTACKRLHVMLHLDKM